MRKQKVNQEKNLEVLKTRLTDFDLALPGRLRTIFSKCGKEYCACQTDKKARHGPYVLWDRKVNGKLTSKMVPKKMATQIKMWIENRNRLEVLLQEIFELSQSIVSNLVESERNSRVDKS